MDKRRIWLFAGLGILASCISVLAAKKYKKSRRKEKETNSYEPDAPKPRYRARVV